MGKRKRATKPPPKKKTAKLEKIFNCPICGHEESVECTIDRSENMGTVSCRICTAHYSAMIHSLEEEVDVYAKWIDALDAANERQEKENQDLEARKANLHIQTEDEEHLRHGVGVGGLADVDDEDEYA